VVVCPDRLVAAAAANPFALVGVAQSGPRPGLNFVGPRLARCQSCPP
jgi:hypothetical protein